MAFFPFLLSFYSAFVFVCGHMILRALFKHPIACIFHSNKTNSRENSVCEVRERKQEIATEKRKEDRVKMTAVNFFGDCFTQQRLCSLIHFAFMFRIRCTVVEYNSFGVCSVCVHTHCNE